MHDDEQQKCLAKGTFLSGYRSLNQAASANCLRNVGTSGVGSGGRGSGVGVLGRRGGGVGVLGLGCSIGEMISGGYTERCTHK